MGEVAEVLLSNVDKKSRPGESLVRLCNYMDVYTHSTITKELPFMSATAPAAQIGRFKLAVGDVLFTKDSEDPKDIAVPAVVRQLPDEVPLLCGYHLAMLRPREIDGEFLCWALRADFVNDQFVRAANGSTRFGLTSGTIQSARVPVPPLAEQRKIAAVLSSIDEAIRATQAVIAQSKSVRASLLDELIWGLANDRRVQRSKVADLSVFVTSGSRGWAAYYTSEGALFVRIGNLTRDSLELDLADPQFVALPEGASEGTRTRLQPDDVLVSITADLGMVGLVPSGIPEAYVSQHVAVIRPRSNAILAPFLAYVLASRIGQEQFGLLNDAGAKAGLTLPSVRGLSVPVPPRQLQEEVVARIRAVEASTRASQVALRELRGVKAGLLEDLISGRVRVSA